MAEETPQLVRVERPLYEQEQLNKDCEYERPKTSYYDEITASCSACTPGKILQQTIPVLEWLPQYNFKNDLPGDLIAGITVAIMHIPHGIAYGLLGNVQPIVGMYMAFFPVLVYFFLGTSRHNSMGTFAVICLMTGKAVIEHSDPSYFPHNGVNNSTETHATPIPGQSYSPIEVATTVTFMVALFQLLMYVFRLGIISTLLSDTLVSGFTTGAAIQVLTSQIKDILGITIPRHKGFFVVINTYKSIFENIADTNHVALSISAIAIVILVLNNEVLKPALSKKCSFPVPIELIAVLVGTFASKLMHLENNYGIKVIGHIPSGLPEPSLPKFSLMSSVVIDSLTIAIVSYAMALSLALIFAQKLSYEVDANQELLAQGAGNIVGSFFSCMPFTASLSRSLIQKNMGGKTQIASLVSCCIIFLILMWIGPFFEPLPKCVLASIIVVALKGMFMQVADFFKFWKLSKMDAMVWIITFLTVVCVSIDIGLLVGLLLSLSTVLILGLKPYTCLLGSVAHTDLYLDTTRYKMAVELPGIKIFHYRGGINFASRNTFKTELCRLVAVQPQKELILRKKLAKIQSLDEVKLNDGDLKKINEKKDKLMKKTNMNMKCLILDFSALSYVDPSGVAILKQLAEDFQKIDIPVYIAGCAAPVYEMMNKCNLFDGKKSLIRIFPTTHDAVQYASLIFSIDLCNSISAISKETVYSYL